MTSAGADLPTRPKRIAMFYCVETESNAHGRLDLQLMRELVDDYELTVFAIEFDNPDPSRITFVRVPCPRRPMVLMLLAFFVIASCVYLLHRIRSGRRFDVVQFHDVDLPFGQVAYVHFCNRAYRALPLSSDNQWTPSRIANRLEHFVRSLLEPWTFRRAEHIVVPSTGLAEEIVEHFDLGVAQKLTVIPNFVDASAYQRPPEFDRDERRRSLGFGPDDLVLVFVALGHYERKGLSVVLSALAELQEPRVKLLVVGGTTGRIAEFGQKAERLGIGASVSFVPTVADVRPLLWVSDAFVFPSAYETFSLVTYEAAAAGLPLLVTPVHGVVDILEDGVNGWLIGRDPLDVVHCVQRALADRAGFDAMGEAAAVAARRLDQAAFGRSWRRLLDDVTAATVGGHEDEN